MMTTTQLIELFCFVGLFFLFSAQISAQALDHYIREAQENSPKIERLRKAYDITREKTQEVKSLPNTNFSGGYFLSRPETRTGPQIAKFSVQQAVPWFGTLSARSNYQSAQAEANYTKIDIARRKLNLAVKQSYYRLYALRAKQRITDSVINLLHTYEKLALKAVETDNASVVDVLKLQIRQNDLREKNTVFQRDFTAEKKHFFYLLNRNDSEGKVDLPPSITLPEEQNKQASIVGHPELKEYDQLEHAVDKADKLNDKEAAPQLGFGLNYIAVAKRSGMQMSDNGKDIVMPMVSVSIPIFNHKYRSISKQNELKKEQLKAEKTDRRNDLLSTLEESLQKRKAARNTYKTQITNFKQTKSAERILRKTYESGELDFRDVLDVEELRFDIETKKADAVKDYYQQQAQIEYLTH